MDLHAFEYWRSALDDYQNVIAQQGSERLPDLDRWYRDELPGAIAARKPAHVTLADLVRVTEWKMARGVWRARNLALVRGNAPALVVETSASALAKAPIRLHRSRSRSQLAGVGPCEGVGRRAAAAPAFYPFFDELVAGQIPSWGR